MPAARPARRLWLLALGTLLLLGTAGASGAAFMQRQQDAELARAITGGEPDRAPALLIRYGCGGCHAIPGVPGADGRVAAPLAKLRERVYVGGVTRNTADNLVAWIVDPRALSPRSAMPVTGITPAEARDVAAYLYAR
ncbi:cytochrome C [Roseomonas sp. 573]|uniref:Cytochrome C n=2 Tax=Roseomonas haemaphysalidis TaxID=2768162 RepID=A0ABS3KJZ0_9PROT|nr:cytochrome C [Roseomonas haemaphysalidis]